MVNPPLQSPTYPHFFKPLLPGFDHNLTIPVAFFSKYMDGEKERETAKLRSNASDQTWEVKLDGLRFTGGWKEFASAHDFRIGDVIIFKHEGDMVFSVTPLGPSCCEIQYTKSHIKEEANDFDDDNENQYKTRKVLRKNNQRLKTEEESFLSYDYCFVAEVTIPNLQSDKLYLPEDVSSSKALNRGCHEVILVNEEGKSWTLDLRVGESDKTYYIRGGWRSFCLENRQIVGDLIPFNIVGDGESTPLFCVCPEEECSELINTYKKKRKPHWVPSSSSKQNRFVTISLKAYHFKYSKLNLPVDFTKLNGLTKHRKIILMDKNGVKRLTNLVQDGPYYGRRGLGKGWKVFCEANDVFKIGQAFVLELIWEDEVPLLKFHHKIKNEPLCV